jgi:Zn-dependent metalloprotease
MKNRQLIKLILMQTKKTLIGHNNCECPCFIIPVKVLKKFSRDQELSESARKVFADAARFEKEWRKAREVRLEVLLSAKKMLVSGLTTASALPPVISLFDCRHHNVLPGVSVPNPSASLDSTCKRAFAETTAVSKFYQSVFGRNSIDDAGMAMISSIHYSVNYNNAFWNGSQMTYGDGDGNIFIDFTKGNDVICHELTHGVTQNTLGLTYQDQPGGLNESISDVFGSMFRQWEAKQDVNHADWLIGKDIMGPGAISRGFTCLRDMSNPAAIHCLSPQPTKFSQYRNGMDPHDSSGIPNFAFYKAAMSIGGNSWEIAGKIWYKAISGFGSTPNLTMKQFANRTRTLAGSLFASKPTVKAAVNKAWKDVGL